MARIKLSFPPETHFSTTIPITIGNINYGGHLANNAVLEIAHEARLRFLSSLGWSEKDVEGTGLIMSDAAIVFRSEAFHGEVLHIEVAVTDITQLSFDLHYRMRAHTTHREIALVKTGMVFFDYISGKTKPVPEAFRVKFTR